MFGQIFSKGNNKCSDAGVGVPLTCCLENSSSYAVIRIKTDIQNDTKGVSVNNFNFALVRSELSKLWQQKALNLEFWAFKCTFQDTFKIIFLIKNY